MTATLEDCQEIAIEKWGTLNTATSPSKLTDGHSPNNQNVWMDEKPGSIVTANGYSKLGDNPSGNPTTFLIDYFKTSDGSQTVVLSDGMTVWKTTDYVNYTVIKTGLSAFFQLRGAVIRGKLWLTNGSDRVATYDGTTYTELDGTGGKPDVPIAKYIAYHDERVWLYGISGSPSSARFSALTDTSGTEITPENAAAWPVENEINVSEGDADIGTGLFLFRGYLYASKAFSFWRIVGYDEYTYTRVKTRSSTGTRFQESVQIVDNLVHFIGVDGLYVFDGEESKRISDIIDPASSDPGVFAFRNLQQPLLNNNFWNVADTSDWNAGSVTSLLDTTNDRLTLIPADDTDADFNSGTHAHTISLNGNLQLATVPSGGSSDNVALSKTASFSGGSGSVLGSASQIVDGTVSGQKAGFLITGDSINFVWKVDLGAATPIGSMTIKGFYFDRSDSVIAATVARIETSPDDSVWTSVGNFTLPSSVFSSSRHTLYNPAVAGGYFVDETDISMNFTSTSVRYIRIFIQGNKGVWAINEFQVFRAGYETSGKFISTLIDYTAVPASFGALAATIITNGETYQFFTQSSSDGVTWDAEANLSNNAAITSTVKRYLRWGVYLFSATGLGTPQIDKVYVGATYISVVFDTGGNIYQWGAFQMDPHKAGQTVNAYYRAAPTSVGTLAASWTAIVPGAVPGAAVTDIFIQIRLELSTADATQAPFVPSFTVNWILANGTGVNTLQNVASFVWLNRYWLSAATIGATANDIIIVRGKATFGSPFHKKDFSILSFARFQDYFIAGSSIDGSIYRMEFGFSKNGVAMDSIFETGDFSKSGFLMQLYEILVSLDRSGPYSLSVGVSVDGGISYTEKTIDLTRVTLTTSLNFVYKLNISFMTDSFRLRFRINGADRPYSIDSAQVYYRLLPTRASLN